MFIHFGKNHLKKRIGSNNLKVEIIGNLIFYYGKKTFLSSCFLFQRKP
jgi:hypothetical protein